MFMLPGQSGFAFGPAPSIVLPPREVTDLLEQSRTFLDVERKARAWKAFLVWSGEFESLILSKITDTQTAPETRREMSKFVDVTANPGRDIARDVCQVWKQGATRTIEGASDDQVAATIELINESWFDVHAPRWNQIAFAEGPVTALPVVRGGRMTWDVLLPHFYDVVRNPEDPYGPPLGASWTICDDDVRMMASRSQDKVDAIVVDAKSWMYFNTSGRRVVAVVDHGLGRFPGSTLRMWLPYGFDWWGGAENRRLTSGTVTIGVVNTALDFVRKAQNKNLLTLFGNLDGVPKNQKIDPEHPLVGRTDAPDSIKLDVKDFVADPRPFIIHALWYYQVLAHAYGGSLTAAEGGGDGIYARVAFSHQALTEIRNEQIPFAIAFEKDVISVMVAVAKAARHRLADRLPDPEVVRRSYQVQYPRLARSFSDTGEERDFWDWLISKAQATHGDLQAHLHGGRISAEEGRRRVLENVEKQAPIFEALAKRDMILNPGVNTDLQTAAQQFGSQGGRPPKGSDDDDDDNDNDNDNDED